MLKDRLRQYRSHRYTGTPRLYQSTARQASTLRPVTQHTPQHGRQATSGKLYWSVSAASASRGTWRRFLLFDNYTGGTQRMGDDEDVREKCKYRLLCLNSAKSVNIVILIKVLFNSILFMRAIGIVSETTIVFPINTAEFLIFHCHYC